MEYQLMIVKTKRKNKMNTCHSKIGIPALYLVNHNRNGEALMIRTLRNIMLLACIFFIAVSSVHAQLTPKHPICNEMLDEGDRHVKDENFDEALKAYLNALNCDSKLAGMVGPRIDSVFQLIKDQKQQAIDNEKLANRRRREAIEALKLAKIAEAKAEQKRKEAVANSLVVQMEQERNVNQNEALKLAMQAFDTAVTKETAKGLHKILSDSNLLLYTGIMYGEPGPVTTSKEGNYLFRIENQLSKDGDYTPEMASLIRIHNFSSLLKLEKAEERLPNGKEINSMPDYLDNEDWLSTVAVHKDKLVSATPSGKIFIWDWAKGIKKDTLYMFSKHELRGPLFTRATSNIANPFKISVLKFSRDGSKLLAATEYGSLRVWKTSSKKLIFKREADFLDVNPIYQADFSRRPDRIWVSGRSLNQISLEQDSIRKHCSTSAQAIKDFNVLRSGNIIAGGNNGILYLFDHQGELVDQFPGRSSGITALSINKSEDLFFSGDEDGRINLWSIDQDAFQGQAVSYAPVSRPELLASFFGHDDAVRKIIWHPEEQHFISSDLKGDTKLWSLEAFLKPATTELHDDDITTMYVSDSTDLVLSAGRDGSILIWDLLSGEIIEEIAKTTKPKRERFNPAAAVLEERIEPEGIKDMITSPDGSSIVYLRANSEIAKWNKNTGTSILFQGKEISPEVDSPVFLNPSSSEEDDSATNDIRDSFIHCLAWIPGTNQFLSGDGSGEIALWSAIEDMKMETFMQLDYPVSQMVFSPDGKKLLVALRHELDWDSPTLPGAYIVDVDNQKIMRELALNHRKNEGEFDFGAYVYDKTLSDNIISMAWSSDGKTIITGDAKGGLFSWGAEYGTFLEDLGADSEISHERWTFWVETEDDDRRPEFKPMRRAHKQAVLDMDLSSDDRFCITATEEHIKMWDLKSGLPIMTQTIFASPTSVKFSADDQYILVGNANGTVSRILHPFVAWKAYSKPSRHY